MGKPKRFNAYDSDVANARRVIENYGRDRQTFSSGSSFRSAPFQPNISTTAINVTGGTFGLGDPIILHEENLGDVGAGTSNGSAINVDWSLANKFRCVVKGTTTFTFINTPPDAGFYQQIVLEMKMDSTGGHAVSFADPFENDHFPVVSGTSDVYTVLAIYASNRPDKSPAEPIFGFNTYQSIALVIAMTDETSNFSAASTTVPFITFRIPYPITLTEVRSSLRVAEPAGLITINIKESGTTVLSTFLSIDADSETSVGASSPAVISDAALADDAEIELFLSTKSGNTARGLKCTLIGYIS